MRLNKFHNSPWIKLIKSYNLIMPKTDLGIGSGIKLACKFTKFLTEISSKMYELKTYNQAIDNLLYKNR